MRTAHSAHSKPKALRKDGTVGSVTNRSAAQRLRLSVAYALLDEADAVRPEHILAAEAVWRYRAASVEHIFGSLRGDNVQDRLLAELRGVHPNGLNETQQHELFGRNVKSERLDAARLALERAGLIETERLKTGGRDLRIAFAVPLRMPAPCSFHIGYTHEGCRRCRASLAEHYQERDQAVGDH